MKEVTVGEITILVGRNKTGFFACGSRCSHYGAPLIRGVLNDCRVLCPFHGAAFNVNTGDIEDAPGIDSIPHYAVRTENDQIIVVVPQTDDNKKNTRPLVVINTDAKEERTFVIVGAGAAGRTAVETLRQHGFAGRVILIGKEKCTPYDRPKLSKAVSADAKSFIIRDEEFYKTHNVELRLGTSVTAVDTSAKSLTLSDDSTIEYSEVLFCTGSTARRLNTPGLDKKRVYYIREAGDTDEFASLIEDGTIKNVALIGAGFIGLEIAAWLSKQDSIENVHCLVRSSKPPLSRVLGEEVGGMVQAQHEDAGTKFVFGANTKEIAGDEFPTHVVLDDDRKIECDAIVVGAGAVPATDYLKSDSKIAMTERGGVIVNEFLQESNTGIYAAGDIANIPVPPTGERGRIEHWDVAQQQGRTAALNMLGKKVKYTTTPYFWTAQFGSIRYCGYVRNYSDIIYHGKPSDGKFAAYYIKDDRIAAVSSFGMDPVVSACAELLRMGKMPSPQQLRDDTDPVVVLRELQQQ
jgi:apoptosis-inducing factor 3